MGLGNAAAGDDGFGVRLAEELARAGVPDVIVAARRRALGRPRRRGRVRPSGVPRRRRPRRGARLGRLARRADNRRTVPQVSTHRISLGLLARWIESSGKTRAWLLGVQPQSLRPAGRLTPAVETTFEILREWLVEAFAGRAPA